jgi:hypothetical protein
VKRDLGARKMRNEKMREKIRYVWSGTEKIIFRQPLEIMR